MNDIDQRIQAALRAQTGGDALVREPHLAEEIITAFRGRHLWMTALATIFSLGFLVLAVWATIRFFDADNIREQLLWGALAFCAVLFVAFMKVWFWLEMHTNRVLRELKRVELLLVTKLPNP